MDLTPTDTANNFQPTTQNPQPTSQTLSGGSQALQSGTQADLLEQRSLSIEVPGSPASGTVVTQTQASQFGWWLIGLVLALVLITVLVRRLRVKKIVRPAPEPLVDFDIPEAAMPAASKVIKPATTRPKPKPKSPPKRSKSKRKKRARR